MSISTFKIEQCKLVPTVTVLCTHNFACTNMHAKPFYMYENQCTQTSNLSSPVYSIYILFIKIIVETEIPRNVTGIWVLEHFEPKNQTRKILNYIKPLFAKLLNYTSMISCRKMTRCS